MEASDEPSVFLERGARATRGKRMNKLLDEETEEDQQFWNQEAFKDEENDVNYEQEPEVADVFDSDFDEDEPEPDEEAENEVDESVRKKKRLIYPGKPTNKKKKKKKDLSKLDGDSKKEKLDEKSPPRAHQDALDDVEGERTVRKSTRTSVIVRQAEREAIQAALQATMKPIKLKKEGEEKRMTQEEMLLEAAQTEIMNLRNLERILAREEEVKKKAIVQKNVYTGPQICYLSKDGCSHLEFSKGASFAAEISTKSIPYPEKAVCAVTGLPAKYRDPKTGLPYATKEAFKIIRERPVMLYGSERWATRKVQVHKLKVAEMRMLRWICGRTRLDRIRNEVFIDELGVTPIVNKFREGRLRWFEHVDRKPVITPVRRMTTIQVEWTMRRGRLKRTWTE